MKRVKIGATRARTKVTKNKGVETRNQRDKKQASKKHVRAKALSKLKRKAKLYDKLQSMSSNMLAKDDDVSLAALKEEMVVDFSKKEHLRASSSRDTCASGAPDKQVDDQVVIEDEFGRTRTVRRGSRAHMRHVGSAYRHQKAELERLIEQMDQEEQEHAPKHSAAARPAQPTVFIGGQEWGGGAVDQWARRLDREQRAHLEEIKAETTEARARSAEVALCVHLCVRVCVCVGCIVCLHTCVHMRQLCLSVQNRHGFE